PIALFLREHADAWAALKSDAPDNDASREVRGATVRGATSHAAPSHPAAFDTVLEIPRARGASFIPDLMSASGLDESAVRAALADLVAAGLVASDGFGGLRTIVRAASGRIAPAATRNHVTGRWCLLGDAAPPCLGEASETRRRE